MHLTSARRLYKSLFCIRADDVDLLRAQYEAYQKQMPLLYIILSMNTAALGYSFRDNAPPILAIWVPVLLCAICMARLGIWVARRHLLVSNDAVLQQLRMTNKLAVLISIAFTSWSLALYPYGDAYMKGHVAFYMALTEIAVIFCLMHLRSASLISTLLVFVPFCAHFASVGVPSFLAIAVNLALVSCAMIAILFIYFRDFANLVESRRTLILKQAETQRLSDENFRIANRDSLTDLPNRRSFFADLESCRMKAQKEATDFAIGIIDLDGFKPVNDTYGHSAGDSILIDVARRMNDFANDKIRFARLGGDEFVVQIRDPDSEKILTDIGFWLCEAIRLPYRHDSTAIQISCSIGLARFSGAQGSLQSLYEHADYALYCAKRQGKGRAILFDEQHEREIQSTHVIENALKLADLEAELYLAFQPIISTSDGQPVGFEALARWNSPRLGEVGPSRFIPTAERIGLISSITRVLLRKALAVALTWPETIRISFNLSVHDICSAESVLAILAIVNRSGIDPKRIDFEVTETAVAHDFAQALSTVVTLRALGCGVSLDDFGTGFSSLSHLHRLPLDKVKVDQSFVEEICTNPVSYKIVKSLIALCNDMGLKSVIEGVETGDQEALLRVMGCDYIQGYYYSKPLSPERACQFVNERVGLLSLLH